MIISPTLIFPWSYKFESMFHAAFVYSIDIQKHFNIRKPTSVEAEWVVREASFNLQRRLRA